TELGGCRCCVRARALIRTHKPMVCPQTGFPHVTDGGKTMLERTHPLGRCTRCETPRALVREGSRVICPACRTVHSGGITALMPPAKTNSPSSPAGQGGSGRRPNAPFLPTQEDWIPKAPSKADMQLVGHAMAQAMASNVF